jgi:hypothetical protein
MMSSVNQNQAQKQQQAVSEGLGLSPFDEDDLYAALNDFCATQESIEQTLFRSCLERRGVPAPLFLYDVTSAYLEGEQNEWGNWGYIGEATPGKLLKIVIGLLTDGEGEPLAARVIEGNTVGPVPQGGMPEQVQVVKAQFGVGELAFAGDRGKAMALEQEALNAQGFGRGGVADEKDSASLPHPVWVGCDPKHRTGRNTIQLQSILNRVQKYNSFVDAGLPSFHRARLKLFFKNSNNTLGGLTVPKGRHSASFPFPGHDLVSFFFKAFRIETYQRIRSFGYRDGALRVFPHGKARHTENSSFFLDATRVGDDESGEVFEMQKSQVTQWRGQSNSIPVTKGLSRS